MTELKCRNCGGIVEDDGKLMFCPYCGTKFNKNIKESITRIVDEARLKEAENQKEKLKQSKTSDRFLHIVAVFWMILLVYMIYKMHH